MAETLDIGIDIGGTFTDVVCRFADGSLKQFKLPTTRADPAEAVRHAIAHMVATWAIAPSDIARFVHGTTVATNAVLERKGATIGVITSEGFSDVLEIGRGNRREIYDTVMLPQTPVFLAPRAMRRGVPERLSVAGEVVTPLDESALKQAVIELKASGATAIAVSFLFSYLDPRHEQRTRELIREVDESLYVSLSSDVDPAFREYERMTVTAFDAYVKPVLDAYLNGMEQNLAADGVTAPLQIMQSRGGVCSATVARRRPVRMFLSGPAAGAIGGALVGKRVGEQNAITVDIGGTSCDIALISNGIPMIRADGVIDRFPVRVAMVDVNAIGSGGGSIAWLDASGSLRVGPHSAGSEPGPVCYGRGASEPTVTDASVVLGYLNPDYFAGGALTLNPQLAHEAIHERIALPMGYSVEQAALGIHRVVNAQMAEGIRLMSINRSGVSTPIFIRSTRFVPPPRNWSTFTAGNTKTMGVVAHVFPWVSLFLNKSSTWNPLPGLFNPDDGTQVPGATGKGKDYGVMLRLFSDKISLRFDRYENTPGPSGNSGFWTRRGPVCERRSSTVRLSCRAKPSASVACHGGARAMSAGASRPDRAGLRSLRT